MGVENVVASEYQSAVLRELANDRFADLDDNFDRLQLGDEPPPPKSVPQECWDEARELWQANDTLAGKLKIATPLIRAAQFYAAPKAYFRTHASAQIAQGEYLYGILADERSRELLIKLIAYRILGHRKVKLPRNTKQYWDDIDRAAATRTNAEPLPINWMDTSLALYDLKPLGYDMTCYASAAGIACCAVQKQYEYHNGGIHCKAESGDIAIDAGGCWGDTSLYFAHEVGPSGTVVTFEFTRANLAVLERNVARNPHLSPRVRLVEHPVWSSSGLKLYSGEWGPASSVMSDEGKYHSREKEMVGTSWEGGMVESVTIDESVEKLGLPRIDFIKMDIEGAELDALRGGEASIRRHRPKMALSLYHKPEDFEVIPRYLNGLGLNYKFYLDHHTIYQNETVLFAVP